jgi:cellulose synthase/poly-beta-1,6-N-acetylglucosamine synthase-like glycosyltransferase
MLIDTLYDFIYSLDVIKVMAYFWPFFLVDMTRYLFLDVVVIAFHIRKRHRQRNAYRAARRRLFRERPLVSLLVPGKNEGKHIPKLAGTLQYQTYTHFETIIVDDGSDDETPSIGRRLQREGKITLFIRNEIRGGKASAANTALRYARGKFIVHIDADSHLSPDSIETILLPFFMDPAVGAVGGDVRVANTDESLAAKFQTIEYLKSISTGRTVTSELGILRIIAGAHGAFRRDVLQRIYGWDVGPGLDGDITVKIRKLGFKVVHEPFAVCYTNVPVTFRKLARQRLRWDRSLVRFRVRKHADLLLPTNNHFRIRNFLASADNIFFNLLLDIKWWVYIVQLFIFGSSHIEVVLIINLMLYGAANLLEYGVAALLLGRTMRRKEAALWIYLPLMPLYTGVYLRTVRTFAYMVEFFFKASFFDAWNPWKVSRIARNNE